MKQNDFISVATADGSNTLFSARMGESYHSLNGALSETEHVFIEAGLSKIRKEEIHVFEIGFGTGLNALLSYIFAAKTSKTLHYETIEAFPLTELEIATLDYGRVKGEDHHRVMREIHKAAWNQWISISPFFRLFKHQRDFNHFHHTSIYDLIYYDAFSPDKQPEMWEEVLIQRLAAAMAPGALLVTYCAKGEIRRRLQRSGLKVERLPGPAGKREMIRAVKL
jgi:tRNA U34 5-methylaminomethyl-2-thiouridine-forming methyltransferase MnmC